MNLLKHLSTLLCLASTSISLVTAYQVRKAIHGHDYSPVIETRANVVNGKEPILRVFTVEHITSFAGEKVGDLYVKTVRGAAYLVVEESAPSDQRYLLYSPLLTNLRVGTKLRGWFVILPITGSYGGSTYPFVAPLELEPFTVNPLP